MKRNKKILLLIMILLLTFPVTGCTKILKDEQGKAVQNKETGQNLPSNVLCQPQAEETLKMYKENNIDIESLPKCEEFQITSGGYEGIWTTIFVKPLAWLIIKLGAFVKNYGIAVIIITILIRLLLYPVTKKTAMQSENMKSAQKDLERLEKKYHNRQDQQAIMQKNQEMLMIYKKYNINPMSGCLFALIQIPLFFAFYEALNRLPLMFEEHFLGFQLGTTPMMGMAHGNFLYIIFVILVAGLMYFSFKLNSGASMSVDQAKQMKIMVNIMVVFMAIMAFSISTGITLYLITGSLFTIIQNLIVKRKKKSV